MSEYINQQTARFSAAAEDLRKTGDGTPQDKVMWAPSESARSTAQILAHCAMANHGFAAFIRGEQILPMDAEEAMKIIHQAGRDVESGEAALEALAKSLEDFQATIATVDENALDEMKDSPFGPLPLRFFVEYPAQHMNDHARQIDYIQTIWGDWNNHARG